MSKPLTDRQRAILDFIEAQTTERGYPPSMREIGEAVGLTSPSSVKHQLASLERKGFIRRNRYKYRSIELTDSPIPPFVRGVNVPILGHIAAGVPSLAQENIEDTFVLPMEMVSESDDVFMLRVKGDSMINAGIFDGDLVADPPEDPAQCIDPQVLVFSFVAGDVESVEEPKWKELLAEDGRFKSADQLRELFKQRGILPEQTQITC